MCIVCLDEMRQRTGARRSREELIKAILADPPNRVREAWLSFQRDLIHDIDTGLARAVHEVSPTTNLGVMVSPPETHFAEGRRWREYIAALGQPTPYCRPHLGPYTQGLASQNADGLTHTMYSQATLPEGVVVTPELENYPYSRFAKSLRHTRAQMIFSQLLGLNELTISLFPFTGQHDKSREDVWERMLGDTRPMLQSIADLRISRDQLRGISLYWHEDVCRYVRGVHHAAKPNFLYRQRPLDAALPLLGFSTRYGTGEVTVITAEMVCCLDGKELEDVFSRGVLLDSQNDGVSHFGLTHTNALHSPTFLTWTRQALLRDVLTWLGRQPVPIFVPGAPGVFPILADQGNRLVVGIINLNSDPLERLVLQLAAPPFRIRRLRSLRNDGKWVSCTAKIGPARKGCVTIQTGLIVEHFETAALVIE